MIGNALSAHHAADWSRSAQGSRRLAALVGVLMCLLASEALADSIETEVEGPDGYGGTLTATYEVEWLCGEDEPTVELIALDRAGVFLQRYDWGTEWVQQPFNTYYGGLPSAVVLDPWNEDTLVVSLLRLNPWGIIFTVFTYEELAVPDDPGPC